VAAHQNITRHVLLRIGGHDVPIAIASLVLWSWLLGAVDWRVLLVLTLLRAAAWASHANRLLAPVRSWEAVDDAQVSDQQLIEVDAALERFSPEFLRAYLAGWMITIGLAVLLGALDVPVRVDAGAAEILFASLLVPVLAVGEFSSTKPVITSALLDIHTRVATTLVSRRIQSDKSPRSLTSNLVLSFVGLTLTLLVTVAGMVRVRDLREHAVMEQVSRAELAAVKLRHGELATLTPELTILPADELPAVLGVVSPTDETTRRAIDPGAGRVLAAAPVGDGDWVLAQTKPDEQLRYLLAFLFGMLLLACFPIVMSARGLARSLADPLTTLDESTRRMIDEGQIRSLGRIVTLQNDEVGRLASNFNRLLDQLGALASAAATVAEGDLQANLEHPGELHDAFRGMLARLREVVGQIRTTALELASTTAEILAATHEQELGAEQQSNNMQEISETVDSLAETAAEISRRVAVVLDNADQAAATTLQMTARISEFDEQTRGIAELLELIRDIADRSDLLALNGSLEAVRAGEAGRGFALVAAEMRRLAERVNTTVTGVRGRVADIERATSLTVESTKRSHELVQSTAAAARAIAELTYRQSQETERASAAVRETAAGVAAGAVATSQTRASTEALRQQADELERLVRRFDGN
jgi:methyl-accepting chemotaxis protein